MDVNSFLVSSGLRRGHHVIVHASYKRLQNIIPSLSPSRFFEALTGEVFPDGSVIFPSFTYCLKRKDGTHEVYSSDKSIPKTGYLSQKFIEHPGVIRTSSPTHSFGLSGDVTNYIRGDNSPESPLGFGSVMQWVADSDNSYALLIGTDFTSFTFIHFLEHYYKVPYLEQFCWEDDYIAAAAGIEREIHLTEVPGCSKGFIKLEKFLLGNKLIQKQLFSGVPVYYINLRFLTDAADDFFKFHYAELLCSDEKCQCCASRKKYLQKEKF